MVGRSLRVAAVVLSALPLVAGLGCRGLRPIYEVEGASFYARADATAEDAKQAIWRAAHRLGWTVDEQSPGVTIASLHLRRHVTVVRIDYDARKFAIHLVETRNVRREGNRIHPNVNGWIQNLEREIAAESTRGAASPEPPSAEARPSH